jgi:hypothetical protein
MPFVTPDSVSVTHISNALNNKRSRTDMFSILLNTMDHLFNRVKWIRNQGVDNPHEDIGLVSLKKKIEWILQFIDGNLRKTSPSVSSASGMLDICIRILNEPDEDPFSGLLDAARELKISLGTCNILMLTIVIEKARTSKQDIPPIAFFEKSIPYIYGLLNMKKETSLKLESSHVSSAHSVLFKKLIIDKFIRKHRFWIT